MQELRCAIGPTHSLTSGSVGSSCNDRDKENDCARSCRDTYTCVVETDAEVAPPQMMSPGIHHPSAPAFYARQWVSPSAQGSRRRPGQLPCQLLVAANVLGGVGVGAHAAAGDAEVGVDVDGDVGHHRSRLALDRRLRPHWRPHGELFGDLAQCPCFMPIFGVLLPLWQVYKSHVEARLFVWLFSWPSREPLTTTSGAYLLSWNDYLPIIRRSYFIHQP